MRTCALRVKVVTHSSSACEATPGLYGSTAPCGRVPTSSVYTTMFFAFGVFEVVEHPLFGGQPLDEVKIRFLILHAELTGRMGVTQAKGKVGDARSLSARW
ncbi:Uncharacterised protein [Serratia fonticola]|uniref:Uncharacterized protein n=1 Tax=Serratia fonticola TaxID=47917 RepID=A0A4U9URS6_SERFO|nr:Uncharacterised protein [Serratia fonticola]